MATTCAASLQAPPAWLASTLPYPAFPFSLSSCPCSHRHFRDDVRDTLTSAGHNLFHQAQPLQPNRLLQLRWPNCTPLCVSRIPLSPQPCFHRQTKEPSHASRLPLCLSPFYPFPCLSMPPLLAAGATATAAAASTAATEIARGSTPGIPGGAPGSVPGTIVWRVTVRERQIPAAILARPLMPLPLMLPPLRPPRKIPLPSAASLPLPATVAAGDTAPGTPGGAPGLIPGTIVWCVTVREFQIPAALSPHKSIRLILLADRS